MNDFRDIIEEVKSRCDIVEVISEYMHLEKSGSNYTGLCPFHTEKTGSFIVSQTKQIYKCFGCNAGGDVISFVMRWENIDFMEAVKLLAKRCGITLNRNMTEEERQKIEQINKFREIHTEAARFYFYNLLQTKNPGYEYLKKRGLDEKIIKKFGLGYSPNSWNSLMNYLIKMGYDKTDLVKCGLITHKSEGNKYFDRFRNRVMFPIFNYTGKVIGFGGRVLDDSLPKYLNSPDTVVFNKRLNLYGLNITKKSIVDDTLILVEGYMDLISLYQNNIKNVVATLGTALTQEQAKLIKRFAGNVIISYDSDEAGTKATLRAIDILIKENIKVRVLNLKDCKDPDDFVKKYGFEGYKKAMDDSDYYIKFKIDAIKKKYNLEKETQKMSFAQEATALLKTIKSPIEKDVYAKYLSELTNLSIESIRSDIGLKQKSSYKPNYKNNNFSNNYRKIEKVELSKDINLNREATFIKILLENYNLRQIALDEFKLTDFLIEDTKKIFDYIVENRTLEEITAENIKSIGVSEEYIKFMNNLSSEVINSYNLENLKHIVENIQKNIEDRNIKAMTEEITRLSNQIKQIEKEQGDTTELNDRIAKLSLKLFDIQKNKN